MNEMSGRRAGDSNTPSMLAAILIALSAMAISIYRAIHLAITHDEVLTYDLYLQHRFYNLFRFDANDHVLYTVAAFCSTRLFGLSALSIRLPALVATGLYLVVTVLLCRRLFTEGWIALAVGLLCFNPVLIDYMSLARGYGPAETFFICGLVLSVRLIDVLNDPALPMARTERLSFWISVSLGLAVCCNITFAVPCAALFLIVIAISFLEHRERIECRRLASAIFVPGSIISMGMLWPFFPQLRKAQFYIGETSPWRSLVELTSAYFFT